MDAVVRKGLAEYFSILRMIFCATFLPWSFLVIISQDYITRGANLTHSCRMVDFRSKNQSLYQTCMIVWILKRIYCTSTYFFTLAILGGWRGGSPAECSQTLAWTGRLLAEALRKSVAPDVGAGALQRDEASMSAGDVPKTRSDSPISGSFPEAGDVPVFYPWDFCERNRPGNYVTGRYYVDASTLYVAGYIWLSYPKFHAKGRTWEIDAPPEITKVTPRPEKQQKEPTTLEFATLQHPQTRVTTNPNTTRSLMLKFRQPAQRHDFLHQVRLDLQKARLSLSLHRSPVIEYVEKEQGHLGSTKRSLWSSGHESGGRESLISRKICYPKSQVKMLMMMLHAMNWVRHYQHARIVLPSSNWNTALSNTGKKTAGISSTQIIK